MEQSYSDTNAGLHYDLCLEIDPPTHFLTVSGSVAYRAPIPRLERARFYLHRQFTMHSLTGRRVLGFHHELNGGSSVRVTPQAAVLDIYFDPPLRKGETALIQFKYAGHITEWSADSPNVISSNWSELGSFLPWFPYQFDHTLPYLTFTLKVVCPPGYQVSSYGQFIHQDGAWFFNWPHFTTDIVVAVGRSLHIQQFESETNRVFVASDSLNHAALVQIGEDLLWTMDRFSGWFGPIRPGELTLIKSPRLLGGNYAHRGIVVMNRLEERRYLSHYESYFRHIAHEAAHVWWWEAPTDSWEDWLNESIAEYCAMLAIRERFNKNIFDHFLALKRERVTEMTPLWEFDRTNISTPEKLSLVERMLYDSGPLLLHGLAQRIGNQRFLDLCRAMLWSGVANTRHLLDLLEELEDREIRRWMELQLHTTSVPG